MTYPTKPEPLPPIFKGDVLLFIHRETFGVEKDPWHGGRAPGPVPGLWIIPNKSIVLVLDWKDFTSQPHLTSTHRDFVRWYRIYVSGPGGCGVGWIHESNLGAQSFFEHVIRH